VSMPHLCLRSQALQQQRENVSLKERRTTNEKLARRQHALRTQFAEADPAGAFLLANGNTERGVMDSIAAVAGESSAGVPVGRDPLTTTYQRCLYSDHLRGVAHRPAPQWRRRRRRQRELIRFSGVSGPADLPHTQPRWRSCVSG
jgi:hypothetical protein